MSEANLIQQPLPPRWGNIALIVHQIYMETEHKYYEIILSRVSLEIFFIKACPSLTPKISNLLSTGIIESASSGAAAELAEKHEPYHGA